MPSRKCRALVVLQLRDEVTSHWLPGKKTASMTTGAGTKLGIGKKTGTGKKLAASSSIRPRCGWLHHGCKVAMRAGSHTAALPPPPQQARCLCTRRGRRRLTKEVTSPSLHKKGTMKEVTSTSMATEKVILLNKMSYFSEIQSKNPS